MNCEEARMLLDGYIDGELSSEEMCALMDHVNACEECARELEAAMLLKDTLAHIDDDVQVPLQAQATWRNAVRAEANKKNIKKWMRMAYTAAALVLLLGGMFAFKDIPEKQSAVMEVDEYAAANQLIARDGMVQTASYTAGSGADYTAWKKISSENTAQDRENLKMLAAEYKAVYTEQGEDICRIELPQEYLDDFLNAASCIGRELSFEMVCDDTMTDYVIIFQFCEE